MRGYTGGDLAARGANIDSYILCDNCGLYWHRRIFTKHLNPRTTKRRRITIISPAMEQFLNWVAAAAVRQWIVANPGVLIRTPEPVKRRPRVGDVLTVDEAVARYGLSRDEIMAELEKRKEDFTVQLDGPQERVRPRARGRRSAR